MDSDGSVQKQQDGTFRSNCMDCLDRTNVIQSLLARRSLQSQLEVCVMRLFIILHGTVIHVELRVCDVHDYI